MGISKLIKKLLGRKELPQRSLEDIRKICEVLFIDDKSFKIVDILRREGWERVEKIKDSTLEDKHVKDAHIIFVDIDGVGLVLNFHDQGLGLAAAIKEKYPEKIVIVYSAYKRKDWALHDSFKVVDDYITKAVDPYLYIRMIEKYSKALFTIEGCIERIREFVKKQTGVVVEKELVVKIINKANRQGVNEEAVRTIFKISGSVVPEIIKLFLITHS